MAVPSPALKPKAYTLTIPSAYQIGRAWKWVKLCITYLLVQIGVWTTKEFRKKVVWIGFAWLLLTSGLSRTGFKRSGFSLKNFKQGSSLFEPTLIGILVIWAMGFLFGSIDQAKQLFALEEAGYILGAGLQQYIMHAYCFPLLKSLLGRQKTSHRLPRLFMLAHLPNPVLMAICWAGEKIMARHFCKYRCLPVLVLAHGLFGATLAAFWPAVVMRVGWAFWPELRKFLGF